MPLDLGAKGSCHIGGNVSTNAVLMLNSLQIKSLKVKSILFAGRHSIVTLWQFTWIRFGC